MRYFATISLAVVALASSSVGALAWWDTGHMAIAGIAYDRLDPGVRQKVDELVALNPDYQNWIAGVSPSQAAKFAFMRAALWADDIKKPNSGYRRNKATDGGAGDNIGYGDMIQHDYWHYIDIPFTKDGSAVSAPPSPNALTQLRVLTTTLADDAEDKDLRSFDLVWILHLAGDLHQPLHATAMFGQGLPAEGDQGGNKVGITATGVTANNLHLLWDGLLGGTDQGEIADPQDALELIATLPAADANAAAVIDPALWLIESFTLAQNVVYAKPIGNSAGPYALDQAYMDEALQTAKAQAALAGARLGNLLNDALR